MRRVDLLFAAIVPVVVLGVAALAYFPLITGTTAHQSQTIIADHCGIMSASPVSVGSMTLQLESDTSASVGSRVCIHPILSNTGITPINLNDYVMNIYVTDPGGKQVFSNQFVVLYEPATLTTGNSWDGITYWNTATTPNSPGAYRITVNLFSVVTNHTEVSTSATVMLSQV